MRKLHQDEPENRPAEVACLTAFVASDLQYNRSRGDYHQGDGQLAHGKFDRWKEQPDPQIGRNDALTERDAMNSAEQYGNSLTQAKANANRQYGLDTYGIGRDLYGDQVSERDKSQAFDQQNFNNLRSKFGDMTGYEQMVRGNGLSDRNEARTERDYQVGQDQRAIDNAVRQRQLEDQYFNSDTRYADTLFGNGYSQNPYSAFANSGNQAAGQASDAWGAAGDLFSNWAKSRATRPTTAPGRPNYGY